MKQMALKEDSQQGVSNFFDTETDNYVKCAYIAGQNCGPRCAACEKDTANGMVDQMVCLRGSFTIGSMEK
jgi:hypothetical protein